MKYVYHWVAGNIEHIAKHGVKPGEAQDVVDGAEIGDAEELSGNAFRVWGSTRAGRPLQVAYSFKSGSDVDYEDLDIHQIAEIAEDRPLTYVYHARELNAREKAEHRRSQR